MHSWRDFKTVFAKTENLFDWNWQNRNWIPIMSSCYSLNSSKYYLLSRISKWLPFEINLWENEPLLRLKKSNILDVKSHFLGHSREKASEYY